MDRDEPLPTPGEGGLTSASDRNAAPFVIALVLFAVIAAASFVFLREDRAGQLMAPDRIAVVGEDQLEVGVDGPFDGGYARIEQVGVALGDDRILVELVVREFGCDDGSDCAEPDDAVDALVTLPEPIDGRRVIVGAGRLLLDCTTAPESTGSQTRCG